jgi:hypothetical protein
MIGIVTIVATFVVGVYIADSRGRDPVEGVALGCLLGPIGWMISLWLPERPRSDVSTHSLPAIAPPPRSAAPAPAQPEARYFAGQDEAHVMAQARGWLMLRSAAGVALTEAAWMDPTHHTLAVAVGRQGQPFARRWPDRPDVADLFRDGAPGPDGHPGPPPPVPFAQPDSSADVPPPVVDDRPIRICPRCAERIFAAATMCRYCRLELEATAGA